MTYFNNFGTLTQIKQNKLKACLLKPAVFQITE